MDLRQLIRTHKDGRTFGELATASHGRVSAARWQQLAARNPRAFPAATTIAAIATALALSEESVLLATGESLGLKTSASSRLVDLVPAAAADLPQHAITAIITLIRSMINLHQGGAI